MRKDLRCLVSLARDRWFSWCFRTHVGELALAMGACIRFRILPLHLGGTTEVIWQKGWCFLPQKHNIGIAFTYHMLPCLHDLATRYCCYHWNCVPALSLGQFVQVTLGPIIYWSRDSLIYVLTLNGFDVLPKVILNFAKKVSRLLWKYGNWVAIDVVIGTWLFIRFCGQ